MNRPGLSTWVYTKITVNSIINCNNYRGKKKSTLIVPCLFGILDRLQGVNYRSFVPLKDPEVQSLDVVCAQE